MDWVDGFRIKGVNKKRASLMTFSLLSLTGGYIPRKRIAVELTTRGKGASLTTVPKCTPYIDTLDIEATVETPQERERC